jgi:threonine dehydrogenase-like Zn-dependent dehydrogenase
LIGDAMTTIPTRTKLLQFDAPGRPVWRESALPVLEPDEVLLKVEGITTCPHWDLHMMDGTPMFPGAPLHYPLVPGQPGHEAVGEVLALGPAVEELEVGMRVVAWRDPGNRRMGCYAQYVPIRAEVLLPVSPTLSVEELASLELAMCVQGSINQLRAREGIEAKHVGVSGLGPSGLIAVQLSRAFGARTITALDPLECRRSLALELGADEVADPRSYSWPEGRFDVRAFDAALDTTGLPVAIEALMNSTRETVAIFGVLRETVRFGTEQWWGGFGLLGYATHTRQAAEEAYQCILDKTLRLAPLVSEKLPFSRYAEGVEMLRSQRALKVLFDPWG